MRRLPPPPHAERHPTSRIVHGAELSDDYAWLRAENWQQVMRDPGVLDAGIRAYLERENAYVSEVLADTEALQKALYAEMRARLKEDDSTVPAPDGPFDYYSAFVTGGQYPQLRRRPRGGGEPQVILDGNAEAQGKDYWDLGATARSHDHRILAYATDEKGSELYTIRFRDLATGENLPDIVPDTRGDLVWAADDRTLFYIRLDANHRPRFVYRHMLGRPTADDVLVYEEADPAFFTSVGRTQSARYILIEPHDHQTSEIHVIDATRPHDPPRLIAARSVGHEYQLEHEGERFIITTNSGGAEDFRIVEAPVSDPSPANWREIVPHRSGRLIIETVAYKRHLVSLEREDGLPRIVIRRHQDGAEHAIAFPEEAYALGLFHGYEFDTDTVRFTYSSMTTPAETYDYDVELRTRTLRKRQEVPSGHDPAQYVTRRLFATAGDGELIPISVLYRRDTKIDGTAPLLLYGYGAYGIAIPASFSTHRLSLVDRGFVFAIAHIRGGKDKGYRWYRAGKGPAKTNTFSDFIAAGEHLAAHGYTARGRIVASGGSAGGMLMGAVANMAPDLFLGLIADVPFVDVLNTMLDADLPLTPPEWPEWGNPILSDKDFGVIRRYSPYDNVSARPYPHMLVLAGLTDPRVTYWEPAKWAAKLRASTTGQGVILLRTNMKAGHGGVSGRFEQLKELALQYAFALDIAGKSGAASPVA